MGFSRLDSIMIDATCKTEQYAILDHMSLESSHRPPGLGFFKQIFRVLLDVLHQALKSLCVCLFVSRISQIVVNDCLETMRAGSEL